MTKSLVRRRWRSVPMWTPAALLAASLAASPLLNGCGGGGGGASGLIGRLVTRMEWTVPPDTYALLTPANITALKASGATVANGKITMADRPALGRWIVLGNLKLMTDRGGYFRLPAIPVGVTQGQVLHNRTDTVPEATFPVSSIVPATQTPTPVVITAAFSTIGDMNPPGKGVLRGAAEQIVDAVSRGICPMRTPCLPITDPEANANACCLDYDGTAGDGQPRDRNTLLQPCFAMAHLNWVFSTCYNWSFNGGENGGPDCSNEAAYTEGRGPGCWLNHKYRNCQSLDKSDFQVTLDKTTILTGEKAIITISNNTPANETVLNFQEGNDALGKYVVTGPSGADGFPDPDNNLIVTHYSDANTVHFRQVTVEYTAPDKLPNNAKQATFHLQAQAYGITLIEPITVKDARGNLNVGVH